MGGWGGGGRDSTYTHVYIYICIHTHMYTYTYVYIYICIHIHVNTYRRNRKAFAWRAAGRRWSCWSLCRRTRGSTLWCSSASCSACITECVLPCHRMRSVCITECVLSRHRMCSVTGEYYVSAHEPDALCVICHRSACVCAQ